MRCASMKGLWLGMHDTPVPRTMFSVFAKRHGDEQVGRRDVFPHGGEVLADPRLLVAELVEQDDLRQVVLEGAGRVGAGGVQGHCEVSNFHGGLLDGMGGIVNKLVGLRRHVNAV